MPAKFSFLQFLQKYPNDEVVLQEIFESTCGHIATCPDCKKATKWHRIKSRPCYSCQWCGYRIFPLAKTPLANTKIPLTNWYYAIFLFSVSKNGVSAKELQRQLNVSYPTAFRMGHVIRSLMDDQGQVILSGPVEMDETLLGGKKRGGKRGWGADKPCVFGMVERGGNIYTKVVLNREANTLLPIIVDHTSEDTTAYTDDFKVYKKLMEECLFDDHGVVEHTKKQHVNGEAHTQTIDGHWSLLKRSIKGTHVSVSRKYLQKYLDEFSFRRNHRTENMFEAISKKVKKAG